MIIKFKEVESEDQLKAHLKFVPKIEYDMISGIKLAIPNSVLEKAKVNGFINYNGIEVPYDLIQINPEDEEMSQNEDYVKLVKAVSDKFIHSKEVVDALYPGLVLGKNVLLYGKGGHGKSEMTACFFEKAKELGLISDIPFVQALGEGLTEEALFGGIEMKTLIDEGKYKYLVENSFMNHEVVIFEELFDAPAQILLSLKDIITSGYFRKGSQLFKIKTKVIIGLTNKSKEDFSEDESLEAFVQRFPITKKVEWDTYTKRDFINLFSKRFDKDSEYFKQNSVKLNDLASIFELNNLAGSGFISPRTAVSAAQLYVFGSSLDLISDLDTSIVEKYFKENKNNKVAEESLYAMNKLEKYVLQVNSSCTSFQSDEVEDEVMDLLSGGDTNFGMPRVLDEKDVKTIKISINKLNWAVQHLNNIPAAEETKDIRKKVVESIDSLKLKLNKIIS